MGRKIKFNEHIFDIIDTPEKAYWIGHIWCDGTINCRKRSENYTEYSFKLDTIEEDAIKKLKEFLDGEFNIGKYLTKGFNTTSYIYRIRTSSPIFVKNLYYNFNLKPNREDIQPLISKIPDELQNHFIRGIFDAEGSFSKYKTTDKKHIVNKYCLSFTTNMYLCKYVEKILIKNNIIKDFDRKLYHRHKDRDGICRSLMISGRINVKNTLDWIYKEDTVHMDRKFNNYILAFKQDAI